MTEESMIKQFIGREIMRSNERENLQDTDNLIESGIIDSMGIQKLLVYLENSFGINVDDQELVPSNFETVQSIAAFITSKTKGKAGESEKNIRSRPTEMQPGVIERF